MNAVDRPIPVPDIDPAAFRGALRQLAGAVSVVTAGAGPQRVGLTATAVTSLSVTPPTILVCIDGASSSLHGLLAHRHFAVNVLTDRQQPLADRFAGRTGLKGADRFQGAEWLALASGAPALVGALAVIDTELEDAIVRHSHTLLIGRVKAVMVDASAGALLYWRGQYRTLPGEPAPDGGS